MELNVTSNTTDFYLSTAAGTRTEVVPNTNGQVWGTEHVVLMAIILCLAFLGNISICWIILTDPKLRSVPNKLVLNLAACGLFTVLANGPLVLMILSTDSDDRQWQYGYAACQLNGFTTSVYGLASVLTLAVISVNRYQMVRQSTGRFASWFTRSTIRVLIGGVWLLSALLAFPPVVGWSRYEYIPERAICTLKWSTEITYTAFVFTLGIFLPFIVMIVAYSAIFRIVRKKFKRMRVHNARSMNRHGSYSRNVSNSSFGRYLNAALERLPSKQGGTPAEGEGVVDVVSVISRSPGALGDPDPAGQASTHSKTKNIGSVGLAEPQTNQNLPLEDNVITGLSLSLADDHTVGKSKDQDFMNEASACQSPDATERALTLAVPLSCEPNNPLWSARNLPDPKRSQSAHTRIRRTSSAPEQREAQPTLKRTRSGTKTSQGGGKTIKSSVGNAFRPPKDDLRVTAMVFTVLASFVLCWLPVTFINFLESALSGDVSPALNIFSVYMIFASSAINPLIYGMLNRTFRSGFKRFFCGFWTRSTCKCCPSKRLPRKNRVSVINPKDEN